METNTVIPTSYAAPLDPALEQPGHKRLVKPTPLLRSPRRLLGQKLLLLPINDVLTSVKVSLKGRPRMRLLPKLVPQQHDEVKRDAQIPRDEILVIEDWFVAALNMHEDVEVLEDGYDDAEGEREIGAVETEGGDVGQALGVDALGSARFDEVDVCHEDGDPG